MRPLRSDAVVPGRSAPGTAADHPHLVPFGAGTGLGPDVLGTQGAAIEDLVRLGLPTRSGATITVGSGRRLGDGAGEMLALLAERRPDDLFRLSASAPVPVAGLPPALLGLGLSHDSVPRHATVLGRPAELNALWADTVRAVAEHALGVPVAALSAVMFDVTDPQARVSALLELCATEGSRPYPADPAEQLALAVQAMLARWASPRAQRARRAQGVAADLPLALHLEVQVVAPWDQTGHGTLLSRHGETGEFGPHGRFHPGLCALPDAGERGEPLTGLPSAAGELLAAAALLENAQQGPVEVDFDYSPAGVHLTGVRVDRRPSARTLVAVSVELAERGVLDRAAAVTAVTPEAVSALLHGRLRLTGDEQLLFRGLPASPGAAVGHVALSGERAVELAEQGAAGILIATETTPAALPGMLAAQAIVTSRGGSSSHAAVVARGIGKPAVCGAMDLAIDPDGTLARAGGAIIREGDQVSVDGWTGAVYAGHLELRASEPTPQLRALLGWADDSRRLGVRANADNGAQTETAISLGAEGIGLCRTEHQFLGARLPLIQAVLLAQDSEAEEKALDGLAAAQREDFRELLRAVGDRPVTVRLLDAPLHEFLPADQDDLTHGEHAELARSLHEQNPMLGVRGIRLAVLHEGLYPAQVRALLTAWVDVAAEGIRPALEIMVPLVSTVPELRFAAALIRHEAAALAERTSVSV